MSRRVQQQKHSRTVGEVSKRNEDIMLDGRLQLKVKELDSRLQVEVKD